MNLNKKPLKINPILQKNKVHITEINKKIKLINLHNNYFLIVKNNFINESIKVEDIKINNIKIKNIKKTKSLIYNYGASEDSFILDMQSINNLLFAKNLIFYDSTIRELLIKTKLIKPDIEYLRIGASGAPPVKNHPGGEVVEYSTINGTDGGGLSQSISGYLPAGVNFSKSISLSYKNAKILREKRSVYSHTAFLAKNNSQLKNYVILEITVLEQTESLLNIINSISNSLGIESFATQIELKTNDYKTIITGRVLKHLPTKPLKKLQDATDIGMEQSFPLEPSQVMLGFGTKYDRYEPEWKKFTNGKIYEKRGHIHATILNKGKNTNQHHVFHLRDVSITPKTKIIVYFIPIRNAYKIYPLIKKDEEYYCKASMKNIKSIIKDTLCN